MSFVNSSASMLATCAGDTVKLFDVSNDSGGDPCTLTYTPTSGSLVNCIKWNHTNLVLASAGDDKKISLWRTNGQCIGAVPLSENEAGDNMEESIGSISFSNESSRYLCSGGSGKIVRIWDLQRKRCIKWLTGHMDTITGVMYNCKNEHLASISMKGDLIIHNLVSGARVAEFKDPIGQVLRALDYSRLSRHILVTAGDDGSVRLWDTIGRGPKVSWRKQHSAPISGVCFSPSNDKIIASVGLDKKLYTFDTGSRKPTSCYSYEAPFSSLAYSDDSNTLAAGTNSGRIVFFDVRGKRQPITLLRAYNSSEAITSLCWQRSKPVIVHEKNCSDETALLGDINEDSAPLMPDQLPTVASNTASSYTSSSSRSSLSGSSSSSVSSASCSSTVSEETPLKSHLWPGGSLSKLHASRSDYNLKDDMDVFSPLVDVQPITPSLGNWFDSDSKMDTSTIEIKPSGLPANVSRFPFIESKSDAHPITDWRSSLASKQDGDFMSEEVTTPAVSLKSESSFSPTPPEAWGGNEIFAHRQNSTSMASHLLPSVTLASESAYLGSQDTFSPTVDPLASSRLKSMRLKNRVTFENENSAHGPIDSTAQLLPRKYSTYAERISTAATFSDGVGSVNSPKLKKTGLETGENVLSNLHLRQNTSYSVGLGSVHAINDIPKDQASRTPHTSDQPVDQQASSSFSLQLVQRTLEETLGSVQNAIHEDVKNLHIELLRQFHMQQMEMSRQMSSVLETQEDLLKEVQALRRENQRLHQLL